MNLFFNIAGAGREEISIELSQEAMRAFNISIDQVAQAIRGSSISQSTGTVRDESGILLLSVRNRAEEQQQFEDIVIRRDRTGATVYLRDIATVIGYARRQLHFNFVGSRRS